MQFKAEDGESQTGITSIGYSRHAAVAKDHWCIAHEDLPKLRAAVKRAVLQKDIRPTEQDDFDVWDDKYGPNVYTVVDQFIKPVTHKSGDQSWSLMLHPDGLQCDLFISHCWAEGIYEIIDKVLNSWPRGARHAYMCMLSNPQNLDIGSLIASPADSPFALALKSATYLLVVPNRRESIYTRIWCVYEIYLAYRWRKTIFVASFPARWLTFELTAASLIGCVAAALSPFAIPEENADNVFLRCSWSLRLVCHICVFAGLLPLGRCARPVNYIGLISSGALLGLTIPVCHTLKTPVRSLSERALLLVAFVFCEADRIWAVVANEEAMCLRAGYTGHIRSARSSRPEDKEKIMKEIREIGQESDVDNAIEVLLCAGMSTDSLRKASAKGVAVESAGIFRVSLLIFGWIEWHVVSQFYFQFNQGDFFTRVCYGIALIESIAFMLLFFTLPLDGRAFAANTVLRLVLPVTSIELCVNFLVSYAEGCGLPFLRPKNKPSLQGFALAYLIGGSLALSISTMGLRRLVAVPLVGPCLANFLLTKRWRSFGSCCFAWAERGGRRCTDRDFMGFQLQEL